MVGTSIPTRPCRARVLVHVGRGSLDNEHGRLGVGVHVGRGSLDNQHGRLGVGVHVGRGYLFMSGVGTYPFRARIAG